MPNIRHLGNPTVTVSGVCWVCHGSGSIANTEWDLFDSWKRNWDAEHPCPSHRAHEAWPRFLGQEARAEDDYWKSRGHDSPPPEHRACPECDGTGFISQSWPLDEFAALIYEHSQSRRRLAGVR